MEKYKHLKLPLFESNIERKKRGGGGYSLPKGRDKASFSKHARKKAEQISIAFSDLKTKLSIKIDPSLIFEIEINQSVHP